MAELSIIPATHIPRPHPGTFSYLASEQLEDGTLVEVSFGRRLVLGLVEKTHPDGIARPFKLKRISRVVTRGPFFPKVTMTFFVLEAKATLTPIGDVTKKALPLWLAVAKRRAQLSEESFPVQKSVPTKTPPKTIPVFGENRALIAEYKKRAKEAVMAGKQVLMLAPTAARRNALLGTIPGAVAAPQGRLKHSQRLWLDIRAGKPLFVIGGRGTLRLPFPNLSVVIVDDESNPLHKETREHPYTDGRLAARVLASLHGAEFIIGGTTPSVEAFYELSSAQRKALTQTKLPGTVEVIDLNNYRPKYGLSEPLKAALGAVAEKRTKARALIYVNRRGEALALSCADCDFTFSCVNCDAPMPVYRAGDVEGSPDDIAALRLRCRHCSEVFIPPISCPSCRGLRLVPRGYAGAGIEKSIIKTAPNLAHFRLDGDTANTPKSRERILMSLKNHTGPAVLIATMMAFSEELPGFDLIAIPSFDRLNVIPDFRAEEETMRIIGNMRRRLNKNRKIMLQTWHPKSEILKFVKTNDYAGLAKRELKLRQAFMWPPFSRITKLTYSHSNALKASENVTGLAKELKRVLPNVDIIGPSPAFIPRVKNRHTWNIVLKWKPKNNLDFSVEEKLWDILPATWDADVSPMSIL